MEKTTLKAYAFNNGLTIFEYDNKNAYTTIKKWLDDENIEYKEEGSHTKRIRILRVLVLDALALLSDPFKIIIK